MNKLQWLEKLTIQNPTDSENWYWLGKEFLQEGDYLKAISAFGDGLKYCDESLKILLLDELSQATKLLKISGSEEAVITQDRGGFEKASMKTDSGSAVLPGLRVIPGGISAEAVPHSKTENKDISFADVAGLNDLKKIIHMKIISPFFNQSLFSKFRMKSGGGVLLYGPPGCGKTFIAKATAGECRAKFINVHITDILDPYIGVSEQNLKQLFDTARFHKPSVMFFDELDAIGFNRSKSSSSLRALVDTFLSEMEGLDTNTNQVLIIGATNMPWDVDQALKRPGRFDRLIFVAPPDLEAREQIFRLKLSERYVDNINYMELARLTEFFSGADIDHVCDLAAEYVLEEIMSTGKERPIATRDIQQVLEGVQPSTVEWLRTAKNYVTYANQSGLYNDVEQYLKRYGKRL